MNLRDFEKKYNRQTIRNIRELLENNKPLVNAGNWDELFDACDGEEIVIFKEFLECCGIDYTGKQV